MFDDDTTTLLEGPASLVLGITLPDGAPHACHVWGLRVLDPDEGLVRMVLGTRDAGRLPDPIGAPVAVTAAVVSTLQGLQAKGRVVAAEAATSDDLARSEQHREGFFAEVERTDGEPPELLARLVPTEMCTWVLRVEELFDQTPGPGAGAAMGAAS